MLNIFGGVIKDMKGLEGVKEIREALKAYVSDVKNGKDPFDSESILLETLSSKNRITGHGSNNRSR